MFIFGRLVLVLCLGILAGSLMASKRSSQRCTAIKVPISTNFPVVIAGQKTVAPQEYSAAFKPILSLVELPSGYRAVGGGAGFVIACSE